MQKMKREPQMHVKLPSSAWRMHFALLTGRLIASSQLFVPSMSRSNVFEYVRQNAGLVIERL